MPMDGGRALIKALEMEGVETIFGLSGTPLDPSRFESDIAARLSELLDDPKKARAMGEAGRRRAVEAFSWPAIATQTLDLYRALR
jgi:starch synthase